MTAFRLLAAFALLGILLAPLAQPAMAASGMASAVAHQEMTMDAAMAGDMSCCPDEMPSSDCGKHCLTMMCAAGALSMLAEPYWQFLPEFADADPSLRPDGMRSGISITPPPRPPRA